MWELDDRLDVALIAVAGNQFPHGAASSLPTLGCYHTLN
jgi:hypothetical protein